MWVLPCLSCLSLLPSRPLQLVSNKVSPIPTLLGPGAEAADSRETQTLLTSDPQSKALGEQNLQLSLGGAVPGLQRPHHSLRD